MISNILVPTDGSEAAQKAASYAIDLAKQLKCSIIVLSVIDNRSPRGLGREPRELGESALREQLR